MTWRRRTSCAAGGIAAMVGAAMVGPLSAHAAPLAVPAAGHSHAAGVVANLTGDVFDGTHIRLTNRIGEVTAPPTKSANLSGAQTSISADLGPIGTVQVFSATSVATGASANAKTATARAKVTGVQIATPLGLLTVGATSTAVSCPAGGPAVASIGPAPAVALNGAAVTLDADGTTVIDYDSSTTPGGPPGTATLTLTVGQRTVHSRTAVATGFVFGLSENLTGLVVASGTISLAQSACSAPALPTVRRLSPPTGPSGGGTTVTVRGAHYTRGKTSVTIGGTTVAARLVTVNAAGTSLTFRTPQHGPGDVTVRVTTPAGTSNALHFDYIVAPVIASDALDPLANTGFDASAALYAGLGMVLFGGLLARLIAPRARRLPFERVWREKK
jgi:hypothetical protein